VSGLKIKIPKYCLKFPTFGHNVVKALKLDEADKGELVAVGFFFHGAMTREMKEATLAYSTALKEKQKQSDRDLVDKVMALTCKQICADPLGAVRRYREATSGNNATHE
jgi:hypothetical protein